MGYVDGFKANRSCTRCVLREKSARKINSERRSWSRRSHSGSLIEIRISGIAVTRDACICGETGMSMMSQQMKVGGRKDGGDEEWRNRCRLCRCPSRSIIALADE